MDGRGGRRKSVRSKGGSGRRKAAKTGKSNEMYCVFFFCFFFDGKTKKPNTLSTKISKKI